MIKNIFLFCTITCCINNFYAQQIRFYSVNNAKDSRNIYVYDFELSLCENGKYNMNIADEDHCSIGAVFFYYYISEGTYEVKNDTLILTDLYTQHEIIYKFDNPYVRPVKTYPFLMNKIFIDYGQIPHDECDKMKDNFSIEPKIYDFKAKNLQDNPLEKGIYWFSKWAIKLTDDEKYEIRLNNLYLNDFTFDLLLFTGTWQRDSNILLLWDTNFEHQFYGLIREDGIELPGFSFFKEPVFKKE